MLDVYSKHVLKNRILPSLPSPAVDVFLLAVLHYVAAYCCGQKTGYHKNISLAHGASRVWVWSVGIVTYRVDRNNLIRNSLLLKEF